MRHSEPDQPKSQAVEETTEDRLRRENEDLKRQLQEQKRLAQGSSQAALLGKVWHPSAVTIWSITLGIILLIVAAFFTGYIPLQKRESVIRTQAREQEEALPRVDVMEVGRSAAKSDLVLPGNIQAVTEAPILARARRLRQEPDGGHWRSRPRRPAAGRNRSAGTRPAGSHGASEFTADRGRARPGARQ